MRPWLPLILSATLLTGCGDATESSSPSSDAGAHTNPAPGPALFDCRSLPSLPERVSSTPASCGTDRTCLVRQVSGHRGAGGEMGKIAPENTLAAYRAAIVLGLDFVETDPRPTSDGFIVNVHDTDVSRVTDGTGEVASMTLAQVQSLALKTDAFDGDFSCEVIPTLRAVLETCRGRVHVLVDANKTDRVDLLVQDIVQADAVDWAIFDTSSVSKIQEALALEPSLHVMPRVSSLQELDEALQALANHPPVIIEINGGNLEALAAEIHQRGHRVLTDVFGQDVAVAMGGDTSVYGQPYDLGADIAQTDRPELVLQFLGRR